MLLNPSPCQNSLPHNMILTYDWMGREHLPPVVVFWEEGASEGLLTTKSQELECRKFFPKAA